MQVNSENFKILKSKHSIILITFWRGKKSPRSYAKEKWCCDVNYVWPWKGIHKKNFWKICTCPCMLFLPLFHFSVYCCLFFVSLLFFFFLNREEYYFGHLKLDMCVYMQVELSWLLPYKAQMSTYSALFALCLCHVILLKYWVTIQYRITC